MNKRVISFIGLGVCAYAIFAIGILNFVKDDSSNMYWEDREAYTRQYINDLETTSNTSRQKVIEYLGPPDITEAHTENDDVLQILFYRTHRVKVDGFTTMEECTPLLFKNDMLIAIGTHALQQYKAPLL